MFNFVMLLNPLFTPHSNLFFVPTRPCASLSTKVCALCTNDTQHLYRVWQDLLKLLVPRHFKCPIFAYIERLHVFIHNFKCPSLNCALILLTKMQCPNSRYLIQTTQKLHSHVIFLTFFGARLFLHYIISLIGCHHPTLMIGYPIIISLSPHSFSPRVSIS